MIVRQLIDRIQELYSKGVPSDDSRLSNRYIYNKLMSVRSRLMSEKARKRQGIKYQFLPCIQLINAPISECCCIPDNVCKVRRSKHKLPKLMMNMNGYLVNFVATLGNKSINLTDPIDYGHMISGSKYAKKGIYYYIQNDYLYIIGNDNLEIVKMEALFEEGDIPQYFIDCCETGTSTDCTSPLDKEFSIDSELIEPLITLAKEELIGDFLQMKEDVSNDASDTNLTVQQ